MTFIKNLFSLSEMRVSILVISLVIMIILIVYSFIHTGDVPSGLINLASTLAYAICGVNAVGGVANLIQRSPTSNSPEYQDKLK